MTGDKEKNGSESEINVLSQGIAEMVSKALFGVKRAADAIDKTLDDLDEELNAMDAEIEEDIEEDILSGEEAESSSMLKIGDFTLEYLDGYLDTGVSFIITGDPETAYETYSDYCVVFTKGVTEIEEDLFSGDRRLYAVYFLAKDVEIGDFAFKDCPNLQTVWFAGKARIGEEAFSGCGSLMEIKLNEGVSGINAKTFGGTPWEQENKGGDFDTAAGTLLKYNGKEKHVRVPEGIRAIGKGAFKNSPVESIELPEGLEEIGSGAFEGAHIKEIAIPEGVHKIPEDAFIFCRYLEKVTVPESAEEIEEAAFHDCKSLKEIKILGIDTEISPEAFTSSDGFFIKAREGSKAEQFVLDYGADYRCAMKVLE